MQPAWDLDKTLDYVRDLQIGSHGIFFYESPREKHEVLFNFLQAGIQKEEGAVYVTPAETFTQIRSYMEDFGMNVQALERDGVLRVFNCDGWYVVNGELNVSNAIALVNRVFQEAMENGLKGLRICGEVECFFKNKKEKELVEYENMIGRNFDFPVTAVCTYNVNHAKTMEEKNFLSLIKAHGPVITSSHAEEIKLENFFPTTVNEVLETIFGEIGKEAILKMLEEQHSVTPYKIAEDPEFFMERLEELIGSGAKVIMKSVIKQMHVKTGMTRS